jgi:hypothetical protein
MSPSEWLSLPTDRHDIIKREPFMTNFAAPKKFWWDRFLTGAAQVENLCHQHFFIIYECTKGPNGTARNITSLPVK